MGMKPFLSGMVAGVAAGALASAVAAGAMMTPSAQRTVCQTAHKVQDAAQRAADEVARMF